MTVATPPATPPDMPARKPHHHGNLREALIDAGLAILTEDGGEALTLRRAAARAGVSHAAPAHHFDGKAGLMRAIAARGFRRFAAVMQEDRFAGGRDAHAQLEGICAGYLRFAREDTALFRLIFSDDCMDAPDDELITASLQAFGVLAEVCALFEPSPHGPGVNELQIWSLVHGYAALVPFLGNSAPVLGAPAPFAALLPPMVPRMPGGTWTAPSSRL